MEGLRCTVVTEKDRYPLFIPSPAAHMASLAAMAVVAAERLGLTREEIIRGVAAYTPADNRLRLEHLPGGRLMINDSYNANPKSVRADLRILARHTGGKRIAMLGDMTELGSAEAEGHRSVGELTGQLGIEVLLAVGARSKEWMVLFDPGDAVLLKASHFLNRFDLAADYLREYPF